ncbi:MAG: ammonium transporter [Candidatus Magnetoovum sp. WYHC-5]|nr:ammonium transporter [Candidatus Magnetoovum sp. WYHC-5]
MKVIGNIVYVVLIVLCLSSFSYAAGAEQIDKGDTAWILTSSALVLLMTPALAMFYGGMVRRKNVLATIMHSLVAIGVVSVQWVIVGYSLSFGPDFGGIIGSLSWIGLRGVGMEPSPDYAVTVPHIAFMIYQAMFAVITPALISGAVAERMKFSVFLIFILLWTTLVYDPVAHWVWGKGGWLGRLGVLDFAGGLVVHVSSGFSALAAALYLGRRKGFPHEPMPPHNLPLTVLGAGMLWFGWFGFNGGSALSSGALSAMAFVTTHLAAVSAMLIWMIIEWRQHGKPTLFGAATASIAGLATITPAAGFVGPMSALLIGLAAGFVCYKALNLKPHIGYDDSLDAFGVHGVGGVIGTIGAGFFASLLINPNGANGLFYGNALQLLKQIAGVIVIMVYSFIFTWIILKAISAFTEVRVSEEHEMQGLDLNQHGESGYDM